MGACALYFGSYFKGSFNDYREKNSLWESSGARIMASGAFQRVRNSPAMCGIVPVIRKKQKWFRK
jgi:hypothetical protein